MARNRSAAAAQRRRRGSVLVLVVTLLGILFVTGVAFLASMNFEAEMVTIERRRDRGNAAIEAVLDDTGSSFREGIVGEAEAPFGGVLDEVFGMSTPGESPVALGEMPGVHNWFSPIEPYEDPDGYIYFHSFTDVRSLMGDFGVSFGETVNGRGKINVFWPSGEPVVDLPDVPVDSDGDGVTDTFQFDVSTLGFTQAQISELSQKVNIPTNPDGKVYLGMRIIAHGGMVNLNESHPTLIANVLDISTNDLFWCDFNTNLGYYFIHGPTAVTVCPNLAASTYSPAIEEPMLRRRVLLPPRIILPSLLHGSALVDSGAPAKQYRESDMPTKMFPADANGNPLETVVDGGHRYTPFDGLNELYDADRALWAVRMEPFTSLAANEYGNAYDRRHLVTTVSYDDLLSRGGRTEEGDDLLQAMREANQFADALAVCPPAGELAQPLPFEYADYPDTMINSGCNCPTDSDCDFDVRKGRLKLSLAWLDEYLPCETYEGTARTNCLERRKRLIYDTFAMLVRNARGAYWAEIEDCASGCPDGERCDLLQVPSRCVDNEYESLTHLQERISRTAAALTANLIDFMDAEDFNADGFDDGVPTRVALRSFDLTDWICVTAGGLSMNTKCPNGDECGTFGTCVPTAGWEFGSERLPGVTRYVYGLERQPYITEVATAVETGDVKARAVELYNPYPTDLNVPGQDEFLLVEVDEDGNRNYIPLGWSIIGGDEGMFTVFRNDNEPPLFAGMAGVEGVVRAFEPGEELTFLNGWTIYLVRRVTYPGDLTTTDIVVDQFTVGTESMNIGQRYSDLSDITEGEGPYVFSLERDIPDQTKLDARSRWTATVPDAVPLPVHVHTLSSWSIRSPTSAMPVEFDVANTGSFTHRVVDNVEYDPAFPTTGSMLLLMRHANRSLDDVDVAADLAFTSRLDDKVDYSVEVDASPEPLTGKIDESKQIDNGRMPVFDTVFVDTEDTQGGLQFAHHIDPMLDTRSVPATLTVDSPGRLEHLPWGQLLWDYFTVLPLSSAGPYANLLDDPDFQPAKPDSIPRVDLEGLRVHGRININAAPWKVLAGLPLIPMARIPEPFRAKVRFGAGLVNPDAVDLLNPTDLEKVVLDVESSPIGDELGQAIVAYREARSIKNSGDYGSGNPAPTVIATKLYGRDWGHTSPGARRGTGFLAVGELANVRHTGAISVPTARRDPPNWFSYYRIDGGDLRWTNPDYVKAVALLVSLGDWATTRSHVFTMYGTLRGDVDESIEDSDFDFEAQERAKDVDTRAVRFQETVDRLPTFLGESKPVQIGQRYVGPYFDVRND